MTLCPVALAVGCKRCIAFPVCPVKTLIGDYQEVPKAAPKSAPAPNKTRKRPRKSR